MAVWMVLLAHRMAVIGVGMPLQPPAAVDVAVVLPQPEVQRAREGCDQRDIGKRPADEVVAAPRRPMDQVMQARDGGHAARLYPTAFDHAAAHGGQLGHASVSTTLNVYTHLFDHAEHAATVMERLEGRFGETLRRAG